MKKQLLIAASLAVLATGCSTPTTNNNSSELQKLQNQIEELNKENSELKELLAVNPETEVAESNTSKIEKPLKGTPIAVGDVITTDTMEITIKKVELTYDVLPDNTSRSYSHYEADAGNVYIHIDTDVKNLGKQNLPCDDIINISIDYNGGYSYSSFAVPEDGDSRFTYSNITSIKPLETLGVHYLSMCPQEVEESENPLFLTLEPKGSKDSYIITIR